MLDRQYLWILRARMDRSKVLTASIHRVQIVSVGWTNSFQWAVPVSYVVLAFV
jgi:hypothetical protein